MDVNGFMLSEQPAATHASQAALAPATGVPVVEMPDVTIKEAEKTPVNASASPAFGDIGQQQSAQLSRDVVEKAVEQINKSIFTFNREMHISVHKPTNRIMVKVWDTRENKVIREIPSEKLLDAFAKSLELAGILLDVKH